MPLVHLVRLGVNKNGQIGDAPSSYVGLQFSLEYCPAGVNEWMLVPIPCEAERNERVTGATHPPWLRSLLPLTVNGSSRLTAKVRVWVTLLTRIKPSAHQWRTPE